MTVEVGDKAPMFDLPDGPGSHVKLADFVGTSKILLLFFPFAYSSVCTQEMCTFRDDWDRWSALDVEVFGISVDSLFVASKFRADESIPFPILSDFNKTVSAMFGALHDDLMGSKGVSKRAAFVIGTDGDVAYAWVSDDPGVQVDFEAVRAAIEAAP